MNAVVFALPGNEALAQSLADRLKVRCGLLQVRRFPDGEFFVRFEEETRDRSVILVCTLDRPDVKYLPLIFAAATARELGASSVGLVAPYLAYMRQDKRFHAGEAITSTIFAGEISRVFDWLITVDPHLHRRQSLDEIYTIPSDVLHAAPAMSAWIKANVQNPLVIGPDNESEQWVSAVAKDAGAPFTVLEKIRHGDRDVEVSVPRVENWRDRTPVLVDDIISTARTMIAAVGHLNTLGFPPPICIGVHAVFAEHAYADLMNAGAQRIVSCNTIPHASNAIDLDDYLATAVAAYLSPQ